MAEVKSNPLANMMRKTLIFQMVGSAAYKFNSSISRKRLSRDTTLENTQLTELIIIIFIQINYRKAFVLSRG